MSTTVTFTSAGSSNWVCPAGVYLALVSCWGSGGGGIKQSGSTALGGGGGGGGAFAQSLVYVVPGTSYPYTVGAAGAASGNGNNSTFNTSAVVAAGGKTPASATSGVGGLGGTTAASTGTTLFAGGPGGTGASPGGGGGGGGSGGTAATGNTGGNGSASGGAGATAVTGGGPGGAGGSDTPATGSAPASGPGGGGGGGGATALTQDAGGAGFAGQVQITYFYFSEVNGFIYQRPLAQRHSRAIVGGRNQLAGGPSVSSSGSYFTGTPANVTVTAQTGTWSAQAGVSWQYKPPRRTASRARWAGYGQLNYNFYGSAAGITVAAPGGLEEDYLNKQLTPGYVVKRSASQIHRANWKGTPNQLNYNFYGSAANVNTAANSGTPYESPASRSWQYVPSRRKSARAVWSGRAFSPDEPDIGGVSAVNVTAPAGSLTQSPVPPVKPGWVWKKPPGHRAVISNGGILDYQFNGSAANVNVAAPAGTWAFTVKGTTWQYMPPRRKAARAVWHGTSNVLNYNFYGSASGITVAAPGGLEEDYLNKQLTPGYVVKRSASQIHRANWKGTPNQLNYNFPGLPSGQGTNLLTNPGFETGSLSGWTQFNTAGGSTVISSTYTHSGAYSCQMTPANTNNFASGVYQTVATTIGQVYTATAWVFSTVAFQSVALKIENSGSVQIAETVTAITTPYAWQQVSVTFTATTSTTIVFPFADCLNTGVDAGASVWLDDVSLNQNNTVFTPTGTWQADLVQSVVPGYVVKRAPQQRSRAVSQRSPNVLSYSVSGSTCAVQVAAPAGTCSVRYGVLKPGWVWKKPPGHRAIVRNGGYLSYQVAGQTAGVQISAPAGTWFISRPVSWHYLPPRRLHARAFSLQTPLKLPPTFYGVTCAVLIAAPRGALERPLVSSTSIAYNILMQVESDLIAVEYNVGTIIQIGPRALSPNAWIQPYDQTAKLPGQGSISMIDNTKSVPPDGKNPCT